MLRQLNILHVDDSNAIILYIKIMLMEVPSIRSVEPAHTVAEAQEALRTKDIDVVILDINLPDGNGLELLAWIRQNYPGKSVIMFSNNSDEFFRKAAERAGADHFLDKSMEFEELISVLKTIKLKNTPGHEKRI